MTDAPASIDLLVQNATIVTFDDEGTVLTDGAIAIDGGTIVAIGSTTELSAQFAPAERIFAEGLIAMPGLIDAHLHTAQTMMKGLLPEMVMRGTLRQPFWREYLIPFESNMTADDMHLSGQLAYTAMLQSGTTTFFDAGGPHPDAAARAAHEIGIRGVVARSTLDVAFNIPESMQLTTEQAIAENIGLVERWPAGGRVTGAMGLRQIMNCSPELIVAIHDEARARGVKVHTHLLEGLDEIDYSIELYGKRPIEFLIDRGVFTETLHCAHSVYATPWDVTAFAKHRVSVCHCGNNYRFGIPRALEMWRAGVDIGLGTDGAATSQGTLDMFRIANTVAAGQQHIYGVAPHDFFVLHPLEALQMATRGGAAALGMADRIGRLAPGLAADIVLLSTDSPDASVTVSPIAFLADGATGRDVDTVIVDGRVVVRHRELDVDVVEMRRAGAARQKELIAPFL
jgi:5-methylthioadenosine/S-adenosylhomocysteine deaminase